MNKPEENTGESEEKHMTRTQMLHRQKQRRKKRADRITKFFIVLIVLIFAVMYIDLLRFPECYITTWKYQLKNDLAAGDAEMLKYYNDNYVKHERLLYGNRFIIEE